MYLFKQQRHALAPLKQKPFKLEIEIQRLFEQNLGQILPELVFVKSEFSVKDRRIDTLAFNTESQSFVIIEYKRDKNYSVVDQGIAYLNLLLEYKAEFIMEYNENLAQNLKRSDVDWSQTKVMFVAPSFTKDQKQSTNFQNFAIELWEIKRFDNDIVVINPIQKSANAPKLSQISKTDNRTVTKSAPMQSPNEPTQMDKVATELVAYTEEMHLMGKSDEVKSLYEEFKQAILNLDDSMEVQPTKVYIGFKNPKLVVCIAMLKNKMKLWINAKIGQIQDDRKLARDVSNIGHFGRGDYEFRIKSTDDKEYILYLIKQLLQHQQAD